MNTGDPIDSLDPKLVNPEMLIDFKASYQRWGMTDVFIAIVANRLIKEGLLSPPVYYMIDRDGWPVRLPTGQPFITPDKDMPRWPGEIMNHYNGNVEP